MDLAKTLIRSVCRAFYETRQILAVDALLVHSAVRDDDLAYLLGMQTKELRKLCAKLEEHRLLAVHNRQEIREGMQRPINKTYYYIDFRQTIDAIKYRIYRVTKEVEGAIRPSDEKKDYFCPKCKSRWTQMEVLDNPGPNGFNCHKCGFTLERDEESAANKGVHEKQSRLMKQLEPLLALLPQIDGAFIPENNFDIAFTAAVPVRRNALTNPIAAMTPLNATTTGPATVRGVAQAAPRIEVDLTTAEEKTAAEQAAEAERKARIAAQNALPVWHTNSTVTGEATTAAGVAAVATAAARRERDGARPGSRGGIKSEEENGAKKASEAAMTDEVAQYYAQLARDQENAKAAQHTSSSDDEDDDDDDDGDEFEDVTPAIPASQSSIPSGGVKSGGPTVAAAAANGSSAAMARVGSAGSFESESSVRTGSGTTASTPAPPFASSGNTTAGGTANNNNNNVNSFEVDEEGAGASKRPRLSPTGSKDGGRVSAAAASGSTQQGSVAAGGGGGDGDDDDDDDGVEFEDV